jgi:hypothetical protein
MHGRVLMVLDGTIASGVAVIDWLWCGCLFAARDMTDAAVVGTGIGCGCSTIYTVTVAVVVNIISTF